MDLQNFDSILKSALDNLDLPYDPGTWAALESRLDQLPAPDAVDQAVGPTLEKIETSYDAGTWSKLAREMDHLTRVRRLRMHKIAEAAILLLLLLNLKGFFGVVHNVTHPAPIKKEIPGPIAKATVQKSKKQGNDPILSSIDRSSRPVVGFADQVVAFVHTLANSLTSTKNQESPFSAQSLEPALATNGSLIDPSLFYSQTGLIKFPETVLPVMQVKPLIYAHSEIFIPGLNLPAGAKPARFYAATFASFDKNFIKEADFKNQSTGYGGGFSLGTRLGKWGFEASLAYSQKKYQPKRANVEFQNDPFNGISFYYVDEVEADVFTVPIKTTRRIAKVGNTSAHALAGVSANFATNKRYGFQTVHYPPPTPLPNPDPNALPAHAAPNGKGLFENGGINHNVYATADLGIRVEQPFGKRYVAFVEPIYHHAFAGNLGPGNARINTFSLQAGVLASL